MLTQSHRTRLAATLAVMLIAIPGLTGCGPDQPAAQTGSEMPLLAGDRLEAGRTLWMGTCRACHLMGVAGAPAVTNFAEWDQRLPKGLDALYQSVLNGVRGPDGQFRMPPRGGNQRLSDEQVRLALEYKVAAIQALQGQARQGRN
jgi:cytochrome c5